MFLELHLRSIYVDLENIWIAQWHHSLICKCTWLLYFASWCDTTHGNHFFFSGFITFIMFSDFSFSPKGTTPAPHSQRRTSSQPFLRMFFSGIQHVVYYHLVVQCTCLRLWISVKWMDIFCQTLSHRWDLRTGKLWKYTCTHVNMAFNILGFFSL